jgi:hypothetical protein
VDDGSEWSRSGTVSCRGSLAWTETGALVDWALARSRDRRSLFEGPWPVAQPSRQGAPARVLVMLLSLGSWPLTLACRDWQQQRPSLTQQDIEQTSSGCVARATGADR